VQLFFQLSAVFLAQASRDKPRPLHVLLPVSKEQQGSGDEPIECRREAFTLLHQQFQLRPHPFLPKHNSSHLEGGMLIRSVHSWSLKISLRTNMRTRVPKTEGAPMSPTERNYCSLTSPIKTQVCPHSCHSNRVLAGVQLVAPHRCNRHNFHTRCPAAEFFPGYFNEHRSQHSRICDETGHLPAQDPKKHKRRQFTSENALFRSVACGSPAPLRHCTPSPSTMASDIGCTTHPSALEPLSPSRKGPCEGASDSLSSKSGALPIALTAGTVIRSRTPGC
jgi:hypothetical protein